MGAAIRRIVSNAWGSASLATIAAEAGLTTGAIQSIFRDRAGFVLEAMRTMVSRGVPDGIRDLPADSLDEVLRAIGRRFQGYVSSPAGKGLLSAQLDYLSQALQDETLWSGYAQAGLEQTRAAGRALEARAEEFGEPLPIPSSLAAVLVLSRLNGLAMATFAHPSLADPELFAEVAVHSKGEWVRIGEVLESRIDSFNDPT